MPDLPPPTDFEQRIITRERLRLLSIGFYVVGILTVAFASIFILHFGLLTAISFIPASEWNSSGAGPEEPPVWIFRIGAALILLFILGGWTVGGLTFYAGKCIKERKNKMFIYVIAGLQCLWFPLGTLLGVATFLALNSKEARDEF